MKHKLKQAAEDCESRMIIAQHRMFQKMQRQDKRNAKDSYYFIG